MGNSQQKETDPKNVVPENEEPVPPQEKNKEKKSKCKKCLRVLVPAMCSCISLIIVCLSIAVIAVSVTSALATKLYTVASAGRAAGIVLLDVSVAISISVALLSASAVWKKNNKQIILWVLAFGVLLLAQAILVAVCVRVRQNDKEAFSKSLADSFDQAQQQNLRAIRLWHATQYEMKCCGILSPNDYKDPFLPAYYVPQVSISCCPAYNPDRNTFMQEKEREICKSQQVYYKQGCRDKVLDNLMQTEKALTYLVVLLIIFECLALGIGLIEVRRNRNKTTDDDKEQPNPDDILELKPGSNSKRESVISIKNKA